MPKAVIYARFSSDLQRDRSIDDQVALCREYAKGEQLEVTAVYHDRARSGASLMGRDGLLAMMDAARAGEFSVLVVEALDRVSRDQEDLAGIYKRLTFAGVEIRAVHDGKADQIQVGIRGLVGALYLQDLSHKVRRGMAGVTSDGRHAGGRAYGYRAVSGAAGELVIESAEADVVRRIFAAYVAGHNPRAIVAQLNAERVSPPRGQVWSASTLNGNAARGHGILVNPIYAGTIVWNRVRMIKDPDTGKRVSRVNPREEWQTSAAPHLAIVDPGVFELAQQRKRDRTHEVPGGRRAPRHLFSGLLKCGCCGGGMSIKDRDHGRLRIVCTRSRESGTCNSRRAFYMDDIEQRIVAGLRSRLGNKQAIARYLKTFNDERRRLAGDQFNQRGKIEARLVAIDRELDRATALLIKGILDEDRGAAQIATLRVERSTLQTELMTIGEEPNVIELHPTAISAYLTSLDNLDMALRSADGIAKPEAFAAIRDLIDRIVIHPTNDGLMAIELDGTLSRLIGGNHFPTVRASGGMMVAEEGFEPPTRGL